MFVMFVKLTATTTVRERQEASPKEVALAAQLKNTNLQSESSIARNCNLSQFTRQASIDKTLKTILPSISVESTTILSPAALANQPIAPKFILTELNNFRQTPQPVPTQPVATVILPQFRLNSFKTFLFNTGFHPERSEPHTSAAKGQQHQKVILYEPYDPNGASIKFAGR